MAAMSHSKLSSLEVSPIAEEHEDILVKNRTTSRQPRGRTCGETWTTWTTDGWLLEGLALFSACSLLAALFVVLNSFNGKPVPHLGSLFGSALTLNTVVSIVGASIQAMFLYPIVECISQLKWHWMTEERQLQDISRFDRASRGVTGSLTFLWTMRWRSFGSFGAFLIVLAISLNPFFQQLVTIGVRDQPDTTESRHSVLPVIQELAPILDSMKLPSSDNTTSQWPISAEIAAALYSGFYSRGRNIAPIAPTCATGNCTFPYYQSLAICSTLVDRSSELEYLEYGPLGAPTLRLPNGHWMEPGNDRDCRLMSVETQYNSSADDSERLSSRISETTIIFAMKQNRSSEGFANLASDIAAGSTKAYSILFDNCIQNFTTTVLNGVVSTSVLNDYRNFTISEPDGHNYPKLLNGIWNGTHNVLYHVSPGQGRDLAEYFAANFKGTIRHQGARGFSSATNEVHQLYRAADGNWVVNTTGIEILMSNVATSVSNQWRTHPKQDSFFLQYDSVNGTVWSTATTTVIRWNWAAGPLAFAALAIVFVVAVIATTQVGRPRELANWKSSPLAMLHALEPALQRDAGGITVHSKLDAEDKTRKVVLVKCRGKQQGWRLAWVDTGSLGHQQLDSQETLR